MNLETKLRAQRKAWQAVQTGKLVRRPCEVCGAERVDAHHADYLEPLKVRWLCRLHHKREHTEAAHPVALEIIKARYALGLTQAELAKRVGVAPGTISKAERTGHIFRIHTALKLEAVLELPHLSLFEAAA